jgi:acyl carrier protein
MEDLIKKIILENYGVSVCLDTKISDLVEDSLSKIEFLFEIEKEAGVRLPHDEVLDVETFRDLLEVLEKSAKS